MRPKPPALSNEDIIVEPPKILCDRKFVRLKPDLILERDYVLLPQKAWDLLKEWHSEKGEEKKEVGIVRRVIEEGETKYLRVEVYPQIFNLTKVKENGIADEGSEIEIVVSKTSTIKELKEKALKMWELSIEPSQIRFWNGNNGEILNKNCELNEIILNSPLLDLSKLLVEFASPDGTFARDEAKKKNSSKGNSKGNSSENSKNNSPNNTKESAPILNIKKRVTGWFSRSKPSNNSESASSNDSKSNGKSPNNNERKAVENTSSKSNGKANLGGTCGLVNLSNTCFMNSALQCLNNTDSLTEYFLNGKFKSELNRNNPLGMKGLIAEEYGALTKLLWQGNNSTVTPKGLKATVAKFAPQFVGGNQHDSQEFLAFLLDGLHEDLNRIHDKPYTEVKEYNDISEEEAGMKAWEVHLKRNKSIIVDLFQGQLKSTLVCPVCSHISKTWDPFMYLSLPLPVDMERKIEITVVRFEDSWSFPIKYQIKVDKNGKIADLGAKLTGELVEGLKGKDLLMADVRQKSLIWSYLTGKDPIHNLRQETVVFAYELPKGSSKLIRTQVVHRKLLAKETEESTNPKRFEVMGLPFLMYFEENKTTGKEFYEMTFKRVKNLLDYEWKIESEGGELEFPFRITIVSAYCTSCGVCDKPNCTGCPIKCNEDTIPLHQSGHTISIEWSTKALSKCSSLANFDMIELHSSMKENAERNHCIT
eukprot:TRINITY_DN2950_c0_g1_i3.p1 TRINITY_DN2950_c0_g1~~TRINITY_DN2950_c0_g1_i3.p1  ORF type:complete len:810 (-),score=316.83 TRINITY_DN2950_c0_g1_i3:78-2192(-)